MFTIEQIQQAHGKVKSGADFPRYIQDLIQIGVQHYETFVADGHTVFNSGDGNSIQSDPKYATLHVSAQSNKDQFINDLRAHQNGNTDYPTFCNDCAKSGVEKWKVDMGAMTCTYYDKEGNAMLVEHIPKP